MTLIGGLTEVVGVGRLGDEVAMLEVFWVDVKELEEFVRVLDVEIFEDEELLMELDDDMLLELDEDLLDICELDCCCNCCRHFARRFLNQTCIKKLY